MYCSTWRSSPEDAIGPLIILESRHLDRETVEGHFRAVGGA